MPSRVFVLSCLLKCDSVEEKPESIPRRIPWWPPGRSTRCRTWRRAWACILASPAGCVERSGGSAEPSWRWKETKWIFVGGRDSLSYSARGINNHQLVVYLSTWPILMSYQFLENISQLSCEHYLFLAVVVVSSVVAVVSVGANEISEGLLVREELPSWHFMTGVKQDASGENDTGADECVLEDCFCFPIVIFHTFRSS